MSFELISFTQPGSTGHHAVTDVGFTPKAVVLWTTWRSTTGLLEGLEVCEGATDGTRQLAKSVVIADGGGSLADGMTFDAVLRRLDSTDASTLCEAAIVSLDSDGFTLDWPVTDAGGAKIYALCLGGDSLRAYLATGTGAVAPGTTSFTGMGFTPTGVLAWCGAAGSPTANLGIAARHSFGWGTVADGQLSSSSLELGWFGRRSRQMSVLSDEILGNTWQETGILSGGKNSQYGQITYDTDGVTITSLAGTFGGQGDVGLLCLAGITLSAGTVTLPLTPDTVDVTIGLRPDAVILQTLDIAANILQGGGPTGFGVWTETAEVALSFVADPEVTSVHEDTALRIYTPNATASSSTLRLAATVSAVADDSFTLDCPTVTGEGTIIQYLAIGPTTEPTGRHLLTGTGHTASGLNNFIAGETNTVTGSGSESHGKTGTVTGDRSVLFSQDGDPHTLADDGVFEVDAIDIRHNGRSVLDLVTGPATSTDRGIATWDGTDGHTLRDTPGPTIPSDGRIANVTDPTSAQDAATKNYVDALALNLGTRGSVRVATTANITIATDLNNGDTLDGVSLVTGDLVLVKDQSSPADNGIYVVGASPARATQFDSYNEYPGSLLAVEEGTSNADTLWLCTSNVGGTIGVTALTFSQVVVGGGSIVRPWGFTIDGGGAAIAPGLKGFSPRIPFSGTITRVTLISNDPSGPATNCSAVVDIWKKATYPPTVADTITASAKPTLSSANEYHDATLASWITSVSAGDYFGWTVDSSTGALRLTVSLEITT